MSSRIIPFPTELRARLPTILGNVDYLTFRERLEHIDRLLESSAVERDFVERALTGWLEEGSRGVSARQQQRFQVRSRRALRCTILRTLLQEDYRGFSCALAGNPLYQWFCRLDGLEAVRVPSKSELQRFAHWLEDQEMRRIIDGLSLSALNQSRKLELKEPLDLESYFLDTTCLKANIHFPVDWVLLRDGVRTLMKATELIRKAGLKSRMRPPQEFLRAMNRLCIQMGHGRRGPNSRRGRKATLRAMKKQVKIVRAHARRHRELLDKNWEQTEWTRPQAEQVLGRIDGVLELLPKAQKQADERAGVQLAEDLEPLRNGCAGRGEGKGRSGGGGWHHRVNWGERSGHPSGLPTVAAAGTGRREPAGGKLGTGERGDGSNGGSGG